MQLMIPPGRLDRPVDQETDHVLGAVDAEISLVEYGSYACPHCRAANERIAQARDQLGNRVCYAFRHKPLADNSISFQMPILRWVNDGLLTVFFLVVGLEVKREMTVGHLASRRSAALPIAAALGGMVVPALLYALVIPAGPWSHGWGIPMATDTAFAIALIAVMGARVPVGLRIFLTAAAIVDDIGAIVVVAVFYSGDIQLGYLAAAAAVVVALALLSRSKV